jgi:hypothetical protein
VGIAFETFLVGIHLQPENAHDIIESATTVARRIRRTSNGAIMLQTMNPETQKVIATAKALGKLNPEILDVFAFVNDITKLGKVKLHALANQLLDCAMKCSAH